MAVGKRSPAWPDDPWIVAAKVPQGKPSQSGGGYHRLKAMDVYPGFMVLC